MIIEIYKQNKRKSKRPNRMKAGSFVGKGSYGCIFRNPPLQCKGEPGRRSSNYLSKLLPYSESEIEMENGNMFSEIDPDKQYFLSHEDSCQFNYTRIAKENEIEYCSNSKPGTKERIQRPLTHTDLIFYSYGGVDLNAIQLRAEEYIPFLESLVNLFEGLAIAHPKNVYHLDIKPMNIVTLKTGSTFHTRFIDFGLSLNTSKFHELNPPPSEGLPPYKSPYIYWPMEMPFIGADRFIIAKQHRSFYKTLIQFRDISLSSALRNEYFDDDIPKYTPEIIEYLYRTINMKDIAKRLAHVDIYMLGVSLSFLINRIVGQTVVYLPSSMEAKVTFDGYRTFVKDISDPELREWNTSVQNEIMVPLSRLFGSMISVNPNQRPDPNMAKTYYLSVLPAIRQLFKSDLIMRFLPRMGVSVPVLKGKNKTRRANGRLQTRRKR